MGERPGAGDQFWLKHGDFSTEHYEKLPLNGPSGGVIFFETYGENIYCIKGNLMVNMKRSLAEGTPVIIELADITLETGILEVGKPLFYEMKGLEGGRLPDGLPSRTSQITRIVNFKDKSLDTVDPRLGYPNFAVDFVREFETKMHSLSDNS